MKPARAIGASEFKAKCFQLCFQLLDRVAKSGSEPVITKHGRPVARVVPIEPSEPQSLRGSVRYLSDIVKPLGDEWTVER